MSLPLTIRSLAQQSRFWSDYFWLTFFDDVWEDETKNPYTALKDCQINLPVSDQYGLILDLDETLSYFSLKLKDPIHPEPVEVAWDDQAHWHPHVLRWEELDLIGRLVALHDPQIPHPGLVVLLLCRFAPICLDDEVDVIFPLLESAWNSLKILTEREIDRYIERFDKRQGKWIWQFRDPVGWVLNQAGEVDLFSGFALCTLRREENEEFEFPFQSWNQMIEETKKTCVRAIDPSWLRWNENTVLGLANDLFEKGDLKIAPILADALEEAGCANPTILDTCRFPYEPIRVCWIVEQLLGKEPGSFIKRFFGPTKRKMRILYRILIRIPVQTATFSLPQKSSQPFVDALNQVLSPANLGIASPSGSSSSYSTEGQLVTETVTLSVTIMDDLDRGIEIIRKILSQTQAPDGTTIHLISPEQRMIPFQNSNNQ